MIFSPLSAPGYSHSMWTSCVMSLVKCSGWILILSVFLVGCKQEAEVRKEELYGKWNIIKAERNGRETTYLRGGYLVIEPNGNMIVNITGAEEKGMYKLVDKTLQVHDTKEFIIEHASSDSLTIRYPLSLDQTFMFYLIKHKNESQ